jgi:hypothetical protein
MPFGLDGEDGLDGPIGPIGPQGVQGIQGLTGSQGTTGPAVYLEAEGNDGDIGPPGPAGQQGIQGIQGIQGPQGLIGFGFDGQDGDDGMPIPGPQGPQGTSGGGGGSTAKGTATINFGTFPGSSDTSIAITGQTSIVSGSVVTAWLYPIATADHSADEHFAETIVVTAGNIIAGTGFTIYARNSNQINEPVDYPVSANTIVSSTGGTAIAMKNAQPANKAYGGGTGTRIYGQWTVGWMWN